MENRNAVLRVLSFELLWNMDTIILNNDDILQLSKFCIFYILLHLKSETQSNVQRNKPQVLAFSEAIVLCE